MSRVKEDLAHRVLANISNNSGEQLNAFDPSWIITILNFIDQVRPWLEMCIGNGEELKRVASRPNRLQRLLLYRRVSRTLGRSKSRLYARNMTNAVLEVARNSTVEELNEVLR